MPNKVVLYFKVPQNELIWIALLNTFVVKYSLTVANKISKQLTYIHTQNFCFYYKLVGGGYNCSTQNFECHKSEQQQSVISIVSTLSMHVKLILYLKLIKLILHFQLWILMLIHVMIFTSTPAGVGVKRTLLHQTGQQSRKN